MAPEVLGGFEHQVLLAVLRLREHAYSLPIVVELEERTGKPVAPSKVYVALRRLENKGFLRSTFVPPPPDEGGRERRVFSVEPAGVEILRDAKRTLVGLWDDLPILDES